MYSFSLGFRRVLSRETGVGWVFFGAFWKLGHKSLLANIGEVGQDCHMGWSWAYLAVSVVGAALVVNAYRPSRSGAGSVLSFFGGWLTGELPLHNIVWQAIATAVFGILGAFGSWPGWVGLAITLVSWAGLIGLLRESRRSRTVIDQALAAIGIDSSDPLDSETMWNSWRLVLPIARPGRTFEVIRNLDYAGDGQKAHRLDVIRRRTDQPAAGPVMIYIHGGAWIIGDKREQGLPMLYELARRGWVCVTINYRLSPKATWPDHIVDCKRAVAWVRDHIGDYGGDPRFVAVSGGSAGGHLSALVALTSGDPNFQPGFEEADTSVDACVPVYGVYDMTCQSAPDQSHHVVVYNKGLLKLLERRVFKSRYEDDPALFELASPLYRVRRDAPPFFILHGVNDTLVPVDEARRFVKALSARSTAPVAYAELPRTQHAFDVLVSVRPAHAISGIVRFLEGVRSGRVSAPSDAGTGEDLGEGVRPDVPSHPG
jgi:acetyl esterase/lipase